MQAVRPYTAPSLFAGLNGLVVGGALLMALALVVAAFLIVEASGALREYPYFFLLPWIFGLAIVLAAPSAILLYKGKFTLVNPVTFATWTFLFPAFIFGGFFLAGGFSEPYYLPFIQDAETTLPLTLIIVALGFGGLCAGYFIPVGAKVGGLIERFLPNADYPTNAFFLPGYVLFVLGIFNTVFAFIIGLLGFQKAEAINSYDGLVYLTTLYWVQGSFLLWSVVFRAPKLRVIHFLTIAVLVITALGRSAFAGSRGALLSAFSTVALAFILSGRTFRIRHYATAGVIFTLVIIVGMIYGSTFRAIKGDEEKEDISQYATTVLRTFDEVGKGDPFEMVRYAFDRITERLDTVSALAVVVSNHEQLEPYEEAYGIGNNIWTDMSTFFIPRVLWPEKPAASDARRFGDLYFNNGMSSTAITPFGDLLRNFGIIGVPLGMFLIGFVMRIIYRALIEDQPPRLWRITLFFMLLISVSYESFYGTIIPFLVKDGVTAVVGILIVCFLAKRLSPQPRAA